MRHPNPTPRIQPSFCDERGKDRWGIYQIICLETGEHYIGTSCRLHSRRNGHFSKLKRGHHANKRLQHLHDTYGKKSLLFQVIEYFDNHPMTNKRWRDMARKEAEYINFSNHERLINHIQPQL